MTEAPNIETEQPYTQVKDTASRRLKRLHASYADAKAAVEQANEQLKVITDGIKVELQTQAPESTRIALVGPAGPPLRLVQTESWRVDAKKLKREDPETYVRFATKSTAWRLTADKQQGGESE